MYERERPLLSTQTAPPSRPNWVLEATNHRTTDFDFSIPVRASLGNKSETSLSFMRLCDRNACDGFRYRSSPTVIMETAHRRSVAT